MTTQMRTIRDVKVLRCYAGGNGKRAPVRIGIVLHDALQEAMNANLGELVRKDMGDGCEWTWFFANWQFRLNLATEDS